MIFTSFRLAGIYVLAVCIGGMMLAPLYVSAQSEDELRASIRASLEASAQSEGLSSAELDMLVEGLVAQARTQELTAEDIAGEPADSVNEEGAVSSEDSPTSVMAVASVGGAGVVLALLYALWRRMDEVSPNK